jgi:hypothetical protein
MEASAFESCALLKVTIPQSVLLIGDSCFANSKLTSLEFEAGSRLVELGKECFRGCRISSLAIPRFVQIIGERAFASCEKLLTIAFDKEAKVAVMEKCCFENCASVKNVQIPAAVTMIGEGCFARCQALAALTWDADEQPVEIGTESFKRCPLKAVMLPKGSKLADRAFDGKVVVKVG